MYPVLLEIGPLTIYSLGILWALGALAGARIVSLELKRYGYDPDLAASVVLAAALGGVLGARLLFILEEWSSFTRVPLKFIFSGAGFSWYGGLVGGALAAAWVIKRHNLPVAGAADIAAPALALAYGVGRIGCFLAGDATWGKVTDVPWGMAFPNALAGWADPVTGEPYPPGVKVHPTQLYELLQSLFVFAILWGSQKTRSSAGDDFLPLFNSRRLYAFYCGILARESRRRSWSDGVSVDESGLDRVWLDFLSAKQSAFVTRAN